MSERNGPGGMKTESRSPMITSGVATPSTASSNITAVITTPASKPASSPAKIAFVLLTPAGYLTGSTQELNQITRSNKQIVRKILCIKAAQQHSTPKSVHNAKSAGDAPLLSKATLKHNRPAEPRFLQSKEYFVRAPLPWWESLASCRRDQTGIGSSDGNCMENMVSPRAIPILVARTARCELGWSDQRH